MNLKDIIKRSQVTLPGDVLLDLLDGQTPPVEPPTDPGPDVTFDFDFGTDGSHEFTIADGQDPGTKGAPWIDSFRAWGVRQLLKGNSDDVVKIATLPFTHEQTDHSLKLRAGYQDGKLIGGMISTEDWMKFERGAIEFGARINSIPNGYHIAFWLLPADGAWPPEEDMLEVVHGQNNPSNGKAHFNDHPSTGPISFRPVDDGWHVYRFEATATGMTWFMDGELVRQNNRPITKPRYWLATWEGNSNWPGPITDKAAVAEVEIDYLRIEEVP
jgi:hypothetical protein